MMLDGAKHAAVDKVFDAKSCLSSVPICVICGEKNCGPQMSRMATDGVWGDVF